MGDVYLELTITNDADTERQKDVSFLVDTGAFRSWIPKPLADEIGIRKVGTVRVELATGQKARVPYGLCKFVYEGEIINGMVIIGSSKTEPLVGTHVLQELCLTIDMDRHTIRRRGALRAKGFRLCPRVPSPRGSQ